MAGVLDIFHNILKYLNSFLSFHTAEIFPCEELNNYSPPFLISLIPPLISESLFSNLSTL